MFRIWIFSSCSTCGNKNQDISWMTTSNPNLQTIADHMVHRWFHIWRDLHNENPEMANRVMLECTSLLTKIRHLTQLQGRIKTLQIGYGRQRLYGLSFCFNPNLNGDTAVVLCEIPPGIADYRQVDSLDDWNPQFANLTIQSIEPDFNHPINVSEWPTGHCFIAHNFAGDFTTFTWKASLTPEDVEANRELLARLANQGIQEGWAIIPCLDEPDKRDLRIWTYLADGVFHACTIRTDTITSNLTKYKHLVPISSDSRLVTR